MKFLFIKKPKIKSKMVPALAVGVIALFFVGGALAAGFRKTVEVSQNSDEPKPTEIAEGSNDSLSPTSTSSPTAIAKASTKPVTTNTPTPNPATPAPTTTQTPNPTQPTTITPKPICTEPNIFPEPRVAPYTASLYVGQAQVAGATPDQIQWDFTGDGSWDTTIDFGQVANYTYSIPGESYHVKVRIHATNGQWSNVCETLIGIN